MTVRADKLVRMAEQVAANLRYDNDHEGLVARVADHLNRFWDPRMKAAIRAHIDRTDVEVSTTVKAAVARLTA